MRRGVHDRRWLPALAVLGVVLVTTLGGFVAAAALAEPAGAARVDPRRRLGPAAHGLGAGRARLRGDRPFVRVTRGSGTLVTVAWGPFDGDAEALAVDVRDEVLEGSLDQLSVSEVLTPVVLDQGIEGQRFTFVGIDAESGAAVEGEVTTVVSPDGQGVVFVGLAPEGLLAFVDGDLRTMVSAAIVGPAA